MWGFVKHSDQQVGNIDSWDDLRAAWAEPESVFWIDFEKPTAEDMSTLDSIIDLDDEALRECLEGEPRPRIDEADNYLLVIAYGAILQPLDQGSELESRKLAIFRGDRFLITIHTQPSRSVESLKARCQSNAKAVLGQGVDHMLYRLIDGMVDRYLALLDIYEHELEVFEERSHDPNADGDLLLDASRIRRHFIEIRRLVGAQRGLLEPLAEGDFDYLAAGLSGRFRTVRNHLFHAYDRVMGLQERLNAAVQNYHATVAKRTNDVVRTLTVVTAVMMPMSLVAGIYGMNVPIWPADSFGSILLIMGALGLTSLGVFRWLKWI